MKRILQTLALLLIYVVGQSQNTTPTYTQPIGTTFGNMTVINMAYNAPGFAYGQAMVYLPPGYNDPANATKKYPLYFFSPGSGETSQNNIIEVQTTSLPQLIAQGFNPYSIDTLTGDTVRWIVIVQHAVGGAANAYPQLKYTFPYLLADTLYRIDHNCVWAGGLSNGCRASVSIIVGQVVGDTALGKMITGIMPISGAGYDDYQNTTGFRNLDTFMVRGGGVLYTIGSQDQNFNALGYVAFDNKYTQFARPNKYRRYVALNQGHTASVWTPCFQLNFKQFDSTQFKWNAWDLMWAMRKNAAVASLSANAGTNQTITTPTSTTTLNGSGQTPSGTTITGYAWTRISGPNTPTIVSPSSATTNITGLVLGTYVFQLQVTNSASNTATSQVTVTVQSQPANPPIVSAGGAQSIQQPTSSATLNGSVTPQGSNTITSITWTQTSGPVTANIVSPSFASTNITGLTTLGTYVFKITAVDSRGQSANSNVNVVVSPNPGSANVVLKPVITEYAVAFIYKGDSLTRKFTYNQTTGHVQFDPFVMGSRKTIDGAPLFNTFVLLDDQHYMWRTTTGTSNAVRMDTDTLGNPLNDVQSVYGYFFTGACIRTDGSIWYFGQDDYHFYSAGGITMNKPIKLNQPPGVQFKALAMGVDLLGLTTTGDVYYWALGDPTYHQVTLPGPALFIGSSHYNYKVIVVDDGAGSGMGYPYVFGSEFGFWGGNAQAPYTAPLPMKTLWGMTQPIKSLAVSNNTIHYVDSLGRMYGIGDGPNGEIGDGRHLVNHAELYPSPFAWSWVKGELFTGAPAVQVAPGIVWKEVFAGPAFAYYNYAKDVNDSLYFWGRNKSFVGGDGVANNQEVTYPNGLDVDTPSMRTPLAVTPTQTQYYNFSLPTANVGANQNINTTSTTLSVTATPPLLVASGKPNYGYTIASYLWTKLSGPSCTITSPSTATTTVTGMGSGTYSFKVLMTDNNRSTWADTLQVVVNTSLPIVSAGSNQVVTLPTTLTLSGTASGQGGHTISSTVWSRVSGPNTPSITTPNSLTTTVTGLVAGTYVFRLTVTDDASNISTADVQVQVNSASTTCGCLLTNPIPGRLSNN